MANQHGIAAIGIERAVGFIADFDRRQQRAAIQPQRSGQPYMAGKPETRVLSHSASVRIMRRSTQASRMRPAGDDRRGGKPSGSRAAIHIAGIGVGKMFAREQDRAGRNRSLYDPAYLGPDQPPEARQLARPEIDISAHRHRIA
ncbi:hypothetical protein OY671_012672, partial [Metschnikowia pulcherrima]